MGIFPNQRNHSLKFVVAFFLFQLLFLLCGATPHAHAATVTWLGGTADWNTPAKWSTGALPQVGDDVVINGAADQVTISTGSISVKSINSAGKVIVTGSASSLSLTAGSSSISGGLTVTSAALLRVSGSTTILQTSGTVALNNGRLEAAGGAVANFPTVTSYTTTGLSGGAVDLMRVDGSSSKINLSNVTTLTVAWDSGGNNQYFRALNNGVIDFSNLTTITNTSTRTNATVHFVTTVGGSILLPKLASVVSSVSAPTTYFEFEGDYSFPLLVNAESVLFDVTGTLSVGALTTIDGTSLTVSTGKTYSFPKVTQLINSTLVIDAGGVINAPLLTNIAGTRLTITGSGQFVTSPISNIANCTFDIRSGHVFNNIAATAYVTTGLSGGAVDLVRVEGAGSRINLSTVTSITVAWDSGGNNQYFRALNNGVIDFSNLATITNTSTRTNATVHFVATTGGVILLSKLASVVSNISAPTTYFEFEGDYAFPLLANAESVLFSVSGTLTVGELTTIDGTSLTVPSGRTYSFPKVTSLINSNLVVEAGGVINAPLLTNIAGTKIAITGYGQFNTSPISNITNCEFDIKGGHVFNNIVATTYVTTGLSGGAVDLVKVDGPGSRINLSTVTSITVAWDSGGNNQYFRALNNGVIDFSNLATITNTSTRTNATVHFVTTTGGLILLPKLASVVSSISAPTTYFEFEGDYNFALLANAESVFFNVTGTLSVVELVTIDGTSLAVPGRRTYSFPKVTSLINSNLVVEAGGVINAPLLTNIAGTKITITGDGQFNTSPISNIANCEFDIRGGHVFNNIAATSYITTGLSGGAVDVVRVDGSGSRINLSTVTSLTVAWDSGGNNQYFRALNNGVIDFSNLATITNTSTRTNATVHFVTTTGGVILLPKLASVVSSVSAPTTYFDFEGDYDFPLLANVESVFFNVTGTLSVGELTAIDGTSLTVPSGRTYSFPKVSSLINSALVVEAGGVINAPLVTNIAGTKITITGNGQFNTSPITNIANSEFDIRGGHVFNNIAATIYVTTGLSGGAVDVVRVDGSGSRINLSTVTSLTVAWDSGGNNQYFRALNNGVIDFSNLGTITNTSTRTNATVHFVTTTGGMILLPKLQSVVSNISAPTTYFEFEGDYSFPLLANAESVFFGIAGVLGVPELATIDGTSLTVPGGRSYSFPKATQLINSNLVIEVGGVLNAPLLTNIAGTKITVTGSGQFNTSPITNIANSEFDIRGGHVFNNIVATSYVTTSLSGGAVDVVRVDGVGSRINLSTVTSLTVAWNSGGNNQYFRAMNNGVIDFSNLTTITNTSTRTNATVHFVTTTGGVILLPNLQSVVSGVSAPTTYFDIEGDLTLGTFVTGESVVFNVSGTLTLNALTIVDGMTLTVVSGRSYSFPSVTKFINSTLVIEAGGQLDAPLLTDISGTKITISGSGQFNTSPITNIANCEFDIRGGHVFNNIVATNYVTTGLSGGAVDVVRVDGSGSRINLSTVTSLTVAWDSGGNNQYFRAMNNGVIDFSNLATITNTSNRTNATVHFVTTTGGVILLPKLTSVVSSVSAPTTYFDFEGSYSFPLLVNAESVFFNITGTLTVAELTIVDGTSLTVPTGRSYSFPKVTQLINSSLVIEVGGVLNAPLLTNIAGTKITVTGSGQFNTSPITNIANSEFDIRGGHVLNNIVATSYVTTSLSGGAVDVVRVDGVGSRINLSTVTSLTVAWDSGGNNQYFRALNNGVIDFSNLTTITNTSTRTNATVHFVTTTGGVILLPKLASVVSSVSAPTTYFEIEGDYNFPLLANAESVLFNVTGTLSVGELTIIDGTSLAVPAGRTYTFPKVTQLINSSLVIEAEGVLNAPLLTNLAGTKITITGSGQFSTSPITNIANCQFDIRGGHVFNNIVATAYVTTGLSGGAVDVVRVDGVGSRINLSTVTTLTTGWDSSGNHQYFRTLAGGIIDLSGLKKLGTTLSTTNRSVNFVSAGSNSAILLTSLLQLRTISLNFLAQDSGLIDIASLLESSLGPIKYRAEGSGSRVVVGTLCISDGATFEEVSGGDVQFSAINTELTFENSIFGVRALGQTVSCSGSTCSDSRLFSFLPGGLCLRDLGIIKRSGVQIDVDGLAASIPHGLVGFELVHAGTGEITGSQLTQIDELSATATSIGSAFVNREIRGAVFRGQDLFAVDTRNNVLLRIAPASASILETLPITGLPAGTTTATLDLAVTEDSNLVLVSSNALETFSAAYYLDRTTGAVSSTAFSYTSNISGGLPTGGLTGGVVTYDPTTDQQRLFVLKTLGNDELRRYSLTSGGERTVVFSSFPHVPTLDAQYGDLAIVGALDEVAPGPVSITVSPNGDGTSVTVRWTNYDEILNGDDIKNYKIYQANSAFTNVSNATLIGTVNAGVKSFNVTNLPPNVTKYYAVVATDLTGNSIQTVTSVPGAPTNTDPPTEVRNLRVASFNDHVRLDWDAPLDAAGDLAGIRVFVDGQLRSGDLAANVLSYDITGLNPATQYAVVVKAFDTANNQSAGVSLNVVTWIPNPTSVFVDQKDSSLGISWSAVPFPSLLKNYRLYVQTSPFSSVQSLTPRATVSKTTTSYTATGLTNGTTYYVAVTAINNSDGERDTVTPVSGTPGADLVGPALSSPTFGGAPLVNGMNIAAPGTFRVHATDLSGVSRIDFLIRNAAGDTLLSTNSGTGPFYESVSWNVYGVNDGSYVAVIRGYDTLNQLSEIVTPLSVSVAPPPAPVILSPGDGFRTNSATQEVFGTSLVGTSVKLMRGGGVVAGPVDTDSLGRFSLNAPLIAGDNAITAVATNRAGDSAPTSTVTVVRDVTIPQAPSNLVAVVRDGGEIFLNWTNNETTMSVTFDVYRATSEFETLAQATKVNTSPVSAASYADLPSSDGTYYYRVLARNQLGMESAVSNLAYGVTDRTAPTANLTYTTDGAFDPLTQTFGIGAVTIDLAVSEPLVATPFLSLTPNGGVPTAIALSLVDTTHYRGQLVVSQYTPSGITYAVFSGRDLAGNRGNAINLGGSIKLDTDGPEVSALETTPAHPIENSSETPVVVSFTATLNEEPKAGTTPEFSYVLSSAPNSPIEISQVTPDETRKIWSGSFTLPGTAGANGAETLSYAFEAEDLLGNIGTEIKAENGIQIYQGNLPPVAVPSGLSAKAMPGGKVALNWNAVLEASAYQIYRKGPNASAEAPLEPLGAPVVIPVHQDQTTADGEYSYAVASVRRLNGKESVSAQSEPVAVIADATAPSAPTALTLQLTPQGIRAAWEPPAGGIVQNGVVTYSLYRADLPPNTELEVAGRTPIITKISGVVAVDSQPSAEEHAYAVTAVDVAGNQSEPSNTFYLNFGLLPVENLTVTWNATAPPQVSWFHSSASVTSYKLFLADENPPVLLTQSGTPFYVDAGYDRTDRLYSVVAIDDNGAESLARQILLPAVSVELADGSELRRGIFNRLNFVVTSASAGNIQDARLKVEVDGKLHISERFDLSAGQQIAVPVVVGGFADLESEETLTATLLIEPNPGESVELSTEESIAVGDEVLTTQIETDQMTRGATGKVRFVFTNTSDVATEIVTGRNGGDSNEVRFKLLDVDNNVLAVSPIKQILGSGVLTVNGGATVARVQPGASFTSAWFDIGIPSTVPQTARLELEIDKFHYKVGSPEHVEILGNGTVRDVTFIEAPYRGEITSVTPAISFGDEDIVITGRALDTVSGEPVAFESLDLVFRVAGFEQIRRVATIADGTFLHRFKPDADDSGLYSLSSVFPGALDRPEQGQFSIGRIYLTPGRFDVRVPRNYQQDITALVRAAAGSSFSNVRLEYRALDQVGAALVPGVTISLPPAVSLVGGDQKSLKLTFAADQTAAATGVVRLRLLSDTTGEERPIFLDLNFQLSSAAPSIAFSPTILETGVNHGGVANETILIENRGLAPLVDAQISLLSKSTELPAPSWFFVSSSSRIPRLEVGEKVQVALTAQPNDSINEGFHEFLLRVTAPGETPRDLPILVAVLQNGTGDMLIHVSDIYTATLDDNGAPILGLQGARVKIQHEDVTTIVREAVTDAAGEVLFSDLPAGRYIVRASASDHEDDLHYVTVRPGITTSDEFFLLNDLITVEWSVREITIEDTYEIILDLLFETDVPAPVLVLEPAGVQLPSMKKGEVLEGEMTLTNYGLIGAFDVTPHFPTNDGTLQFEFLAEVPDTLGPNDRVIIPYRLTAVRDFDPAEESGATGGDACGYSAHLSVSASTICINGKQIKVSSNWLHFIRTGHCPSSGGGGGGSVVGGGGGGGTRTEPREVDLIPEYQCLPGIDCRENGKSPNS